MPDTVSLPSSTRASRRSFLAATAASGVAGALMGASGVRAHEQTTNQLQLDLTDPADNVYALVKIQGDVSGKFTVSWGQGHIFGIKDAEMARPMLRYQSCRMGVYERQPDGAFRFRYRGLILYQDYASGAYIDRFENPYTGRSVDVRNWRSSIGELTYTKQGVRAARAFNGNTGKPYGEPYVLPWVRAGNIIWTTLDERVEYERPSDLEWRRDNAILRYESRWDELVDPNRTAASASTSFQTHIDWFSWLEMDDKSGGLMQGGAGRKFGSLEELPAEFLSAAETKFPGFIDERF